MQGGSGPGRKRPRVQCLGRHGSFGTEHERVRCFVEPANKMPTCASLYRTCVPYMCSTCLLNLRLSITEFNMNVNFHNRNDPHTHPTHTHTHHCSARTLMLNDHDKIGQSSQTHTHTHTHLHLLHRRRDVLVAPHHRTQLRTHRGM